MGYIDQIMGDTEQVVYRTHLHVVVLCQRTVGWLLAFVVFLGLGLAVLVPPNDEQGTKIRFLIGLSALASLVMPVYLIISAWIRGHRRGDFLAQIWRPVVAGIVILTVALVMMLRPDLRYAGWVAVILAFVALAELVRSLLDWLNERYIITNRRVMEVRGTVNKHVRDSALEKVNDVELTQSLFGRLLGYGTVQIITGSDIGVNRFRRISSPARFKRVMLNAKERLQDDTVPTRPKEGASLDEPVAPAGTDSSEAVPPAGPDIPDLIIELDGLRQKGILSEEEFQAKKRDLLDRL